MRVAAGKLRVAINDVMEPIGHDTEKEWAQLQSAWRVLDQYVRLQRLEQGLKWIGDESDSGLQKWMAGTGNPLQDLLDAIHIRTYTPTLSLAADNISDAVETLNSYIYTNNTERTELLLEIGNVFTAERGRRYNVLRDAAHLFILELPRLVHQVELANWPQSESRPRTAEAIEADPTSHRFLAYIATEEGRKEFEKKVREALANAYHEKLRRCPKGNRSGSDLR